MLGRAVRRAAGIQDGEPLEEQRRKLRAAGRAATSTATPCARVAAFLGEIAGVPFPDEDNERAARGARRTRS